LLVAEDVYINLGAVVNIAHTAPVHWVHSRVLNSGDFRAVTTGGLKILHNSIETIRAGKSI
jgi:hypothetical protein